MKYIPVQDFVNNGYLQEVNRLVLHPCGLALEVTITDSGEYLLSGILDYRDDPEGCAYGELVEKHKALLVEIEKQKHIKSRLSSFGWVIQPVGSKV